MTNLEFPDEPVLVEARFLADGQVWPTAFHWRGQRHAVKETGRQWDAEIAGQEWRCCLVQDDGLDTFELRLERATGRWVLARAWLHDRRV